MKFGSVQNLSSGTELMFGKEEKISKSTCNDDQKTKTTA